MDTVTNFAILGLLVFLVYMYGVINDLRDRLAWQQRQITSLSDMIKEAGLVDCLEKIRQANLDTVDEQDD